MGVFFPFLHHDKGIFSQPGTLLSPITRGVWGGVAVRVQGSAAEPPSASTGRRRKGGGWGVVEGGSN